jgi:hypothetical protein
LTLRIQLGWSPTVPAARCHLIPHRWWPEIRTLLLPRGASSVEYRGLGGPFGRGLIAVSGAGESAALRVVGRYDIDLSEEITLPRPGRAASRFDVAEAAGLEPLKEGLSSSARQFYAAISPIPLFWVPDGEIGSVAFPLVQLVRSMAARGMHGTIRGFAPSPFLPVAISAPWSAGALTWTSDASEFELGGLPSGTYRVRGLDVFGRVTFASGADVGIERKTKQAIRLWSTVDLTEPDSRQVMGFVRWESGASAEKAAVFLQNAEDFRRYVRRIETDEHGYFRFTNVPGNAPYLLFAMPPDQTDAMKAFTYFGTLQHQRELWRELTLHPHLVTGALDGLNRTEERQSPQGQPDGAVLQLFRIDRNAESIVWRFRPESSGRFTVSNVPHGRYRVRAVRGEKSKAIDSVPFDVGDSGPETVVNWYSQ